MAYDDNEVKRLLLGGDPGGQGSGGKEPTQITDEDLADSDNAHQKAHGDRYSDILTDYQKHIGRTLVSKFAFKWIFFVVSIVVLIASPILFCCIFFRFASDGGSAAELSALLPLGAALIQFLTSYLVLPRVIAEYLFDANEENSLVKIIENMQKYDMEIRRNKKGQ